MRSSIVSKSLNPLMKISSTLMIYYRKGGLDMLQFEQIAFDYIDDV
jgi:hypothetical protein